jgi:peptidoglycan/xylan/chitin deacetylase (PgdA/CDA1 family)
MGKGQIAPARYRQLPLRGVPVFLYHGLSHTTTIAVPSRERKYWVERREFEQHLKQIRACGYGVRKLGQLWKEAKTWEGPTAALTFDDGLASDYEIAYPLLHEFGLRADFFVNTANVGRPGFLTWAQIVEMQQAGLSFQSHSHEHVYLTWLPPQGLEQQLRHSKQTLEDRLGRQVNFLSAPFGELNSRVVKAAQEAGYRAVCGTRSWPATPGAQLVNRVVIDRNTTAADFRRLLTGSLVGYAARAVRECLVYLPKRLMLRFRPSPPPQGDTRLGEAV